MSRTRDIIQEITGIRERCQFNSAVLELTTRLFALERAFRERVRFDVETIRYFPVAIVSCLEGYFRIAIKELVDAGDPYFANSEKVLFSKLDFSLIRAIHGKKITIGELIAHNIPISRMEHIETSLSNLIGKSFLGEIRNTTDRWAHEFRGDPISPILEKPDEVYGNVEKTFNLRHIICHEIASAHKISVEEIELCFGSCVSFLRAANACVEELLHPGVPLTQTEMNIAAGQSYQRAKLKLDVIIDHIKEFFSPEKCESFDKVNQLWKTYQERHADFMASRYEGGSIKPLIQASALESVTVARIVELETELNYMKNTLVPYERNQSI